MRYATAALIFVALQSCATVNFKAPHNRFLVPENSGDMLSGKVGLGYGSKSSIVLVENLATENPNVEKPEIQFTDGTNGVAELSLFPLIDFFYASTGPGVKIQFWGDPETESQSGNLSLAFAVARETASHTETDNFGSGGTTFENKGTAKYQFNDVMALIGYRKSDSTLVYLNVANNFMEASGNIARIKSAGTSMETSTLKIPAQKGRETSILLGYQISSDHFFWILEPGYSRIQWANTDTRERFTLGSALGFKW